MENSLFSLKSIGLATIYRQRHSLLIPGKEAKYRLIKLLSQGILLGINKRQSDFTTWNRARDKRLHISSEDSQF